jgi:hypothetical protein
MDSRVCGGIAITSVQTWDAPDGSNITTQAGWAASDAGNPEEAPVTGPEEAVAHISFNCQKKDPKSGLSCKPRQSWQKVYCAGRVRSRPEY